MSVLMCQNAFTWLCPARLVLHSGRLSGSRQTHRVNNVPRVNNHFITHLTTNNGYSFQHCSLHWTHSTLRHCVLKFTARMPEIVQLFSLKTNNAGVIERCLQDIVDRFRKCKGRQLQTNRWHCHSKWNAGVSNLCCYFLRVWSTN